VVVFVDFQQSKREAGQSGIDGPTAIVTVVFNLHLDILKLREHMRCRAVANKITGSHVEGEHCRECEQLEKTDIP